MSDILAGNWKQLKGRLKEKWGDLTDDDLDKIDGQRERLIGVIQEKYGKEKQQAQQEVDAYLAEAEADAETN